MEGSSTCVQIGGVSITYKGSARGPICLACGGLGHRPEVCPTRPRNLLTRAEKRRERSKARAAKAKRKAKKAIKQKKAKAMEQKYAPLVETATEASASLGIEEFFAMAPIEVILLIIMGVHMSGLFEIKTPDKYILRNNIRVIMRGVIWNMETLSCVSKKMFCTFYKSSTSIEIHKALVCVKSGLHRLYDTLDSGEAHSHSWIHRNQSILVNFTVENKSGVDIMVTPYFNKSVTRMWYYIKDGETKSFETHSAKLSFKLNRQLIIAPGPDKIVGFTQADWYRCYRVTCNHNASQESTSGVVSLEKVTIGEFRNSTTPPANFTKIKDVTMFDKIRLVTSDNPKELIAARMRQLSDRLDRSAVVVSKMENLSRMYENMTQRNRDDLLAQRMMVERIIREMETLSQSR